MLEKRDNYQLQAMQAKKLFLTYDQQELIKRCRLRFDREYFYVKFLGEEHRIARRTGDMERLRMGRWMDGNAFGAVMTILDWLCDSCPDRYLSGRLVNIATHGHYFHGSLQERSHAAEAALFDKNPEAFCKACEAMGGQKISGGDIGYAIELLDGLKICLRLWRGDEEFPARLLCLWDENTTSYIRYETTWFAVGLLMERLRENMPPTCRE